MPRSRSDARHDYRHFPPAYTELLLEFSRNYYARIGPMTLREATTARRDLTRFFGFLRNAPPDDEHARMLTDIATEVVCRIVPSAQEANRRAEGPRPSVVGVNTGDCYLTLTRNPITRALASSTQDNSRRTPP